MNLIEKIDKLEAELDSIVGTLSPQAQIKASAALEHLRFVRGYLAEQQHAGGCLQSVPPVPGAPLDPVLEIQSGHGHVY
ncbi:MAG: hypothetical protein AAF065_11920 [Verrucomicrobiota bacterium]